MLLGIFIALSLREPGQESLSRLTDLLAGRKVDVFLTGFGTPFGDDFFAEDVLIVENHEDLGGLRVNVGVFFSTEADESLDAAKKGFLVFLASDHLRLMLVHTSSQWVRINSLS